MGLRMMHCPDVSGPDTPYIVHLADIASAPAESFSSIYGYCMAIAAPGFGLPVVGLGPSLVHWWGFLLLWLACSGAIAALIHKKLSKTGLGYASR